jgi:8-oxo-dGTP pyrophosphatase MutT (NUDIX family)
MPRREFRPNEVSAGGVLLRRRDGAAEVCLVFDGRHWGIPKGNVERGEAAQEAALREIHEEVGLPVAALRIGEELPASEYVYRRQGRLVFKRVHQYIVEVTDESPLQPDGREIVEARWVPLPEARTLASFADTVRAIDAAARVVGVHAQPGS